MRLFQLNVTKTKASAGAPIKIPMGIVGAEMVIRFSQEWDGLTKTVVFRAGDVTKDVLNVQDTVVIPAECTQVVGTALDVGVYGTDADDLVAIPTLWATLGTVYDATDPSGDTSTDPTLPVWAQLLAMFDELSEKHGTDGATFFPAVSDDGVLSWTNNKGLDNPEPVNIKGKDGTNGIDGYTPVKGKDYFDGKDGKDGKDGAAGKDGRTPEKGVDYFTVAEKAEIVADVLDAIPADGVYGTTPVFETTLSETLTTYLNVNKKADGTPLRLKAALVMIETAETAGGETYCHALCNGVLVQQSPLDVAAEKSYAYVECYLRHGKWRTSRHTFVSRTSSYTHYPINPYRDINFDVEQYPVIDSIRFYYLPAGTKIKIYGVEENV